VACTRYNTGWQNSSVPLGLDNYTIVHKSTDTAVSLFRTDFASRHWDNTRFDLQLASDRSCEGPQVHDTRMVQLNDTAR
jgi:hypothetical protein